MSTATLDMSGLPAAAGKHLGYTEWEEMTQTRVNQFADATGDHQWIHVDVERARRESPYGGTIAHGYLTLSLAASLCIEAGAIPSDASAALNYGLDKVRFMAPVRAGARVRNRVVLASCERKATDRVLIRLQNTIEIEGEDKPALVAESLALLMDARGA